MILGILTLICIYTTPVGLAWQIALTIFAIINICKSIISDIAFAIKKGLE